MEVKYETERNLAANARTDSVVGRDRKSLSVSADRNEKPPRFVLSDLLNGSREAIIEHDGQDYRLRVTSNGKLILTK